MKKIACFITGMLAALLLILSYDASAFEITFKSHGKEIAKIPIENLKKSLGVKDVEVFDPVLNEKTHYQAFDFKELLSIVYKNEWKSAEEVLFTCSDGYQPSIPMSRFQEHAGFLAFALKQGAKFEVPHKSDGSNKIIPLGPTYLVWKDDPEVRADAETDWPYQVISIDLVDFVEKFPRLAPPKGASTQIQKGFAEFRKFCIACHTMNGDGGGRAPELNYPVNVTEYFKEEWFYRFVNNPQGVRANSAMSPFATQIENDRLHLKDVYAYLKAMQKRKIKGDK